MIFEEFEYAVEEEHKDKFKSDVNKAVMIFGERWRPYNIITWTACYEMWKKEVGMDRKVVNTLRIQ